MAGRKPKKRTNCFLFILIGSLILFLPHLYARWISRGLINNSQNISPRTTAVVFGAGIYRNHMPTPVLEDRLVTAIELYQNGKVSKILMSGHALDLYNEPEVMKQFALTKGVPEEDIILDLEGNRTFDTCYRIKNVYNISDPVLVTQGFHLPRALMICKHMNIDVVGVQSDLRQYRISSSLWWNLREIPATTYSFFESIFTKMN